MATPEVGKLYVPSGSAEIRDDFLTDIRLAAISAGIAEPPVQPNTDWYILGEAIGNIALTQYANIAIQEANADVLAASGAALDRIREAVGLPEVEPTGSSGKIVVGVTAGSASIPADTPLVLPNGLRAKVVGTWIGVTDGDEIDVTAIDTGANTNFPAGAKVRFITAPVNVKTDATVALSFPLTGGVESETDERKRVRILNRLRNLPRGGSWGHMREIALNASGAIRDAFVYPALGGPASAKVVIVKYFDRENNDYSPEPSAALVNLVRSKLHAELPSPMEIVVEGPLSVELGTTIKFTLPESSQAGGNGSGWRDATVWPDLAGGQTRVLVSVVTSTTDIRVDATTTTSPIAGQTHISWWSPQDQRFREALVTGVAGSSGAWDLTLDTPLVDSTGASVAVGDYISPAAENAVAYGKTWVDLTEQFGTNENTSDANRLPRALRHPFVSDESPSDLTITQLTAFQNAHKEITDAAYGFTQVSSVPLTVAIAPSVWRPKHFGIYKK